MKSLRESVLEVYSRQPDKAKVESKAVVSYSYQGKFHKEVFI